MTGIKWPLYRYCVCRYCVCPSPTDRQSCPCSFWAADEGEETGFMEPSSNIWSKFNPLVLWKYFLNKNELKVSTFSSNRKFGCFWFPVLKQTLSKLFLNFFEEHPEHFVTRNFSKLSKINNPSGPVTWPHGTHVIIAWPAYF